MALSSQEALKGKGFCTCFSKWNGSIELVVKLPKHSDGLDMMHKEWLRDPTARYEKYHPEYAGFGDCMKSFRAQSSGWIELKPLINFLFCVESFILDKNNMTGRDDSTRMV